MDKSKHILIIYLGILLLCALSPVLADSVHKQNSVALESLVAEAILGNPELKYYEAQIAAAKGERRSAGQWKNPEVDVEYGEKRVRSRSDDLIGKGNAQRYSLNQTFEFPGKASLRKAIADQNVRLAELSLEQLRLEIAAKARSLAIQWLTTEMEAKAAKEIEERHEALVKVLRGRANAGVQSVVDRRIIEADRIQILAHSHQVEERELAARIALNVLRGKSPTAPIQLRTSLSLPPLNQSFAAIFEKALKNNLDLKIRGIEIEKASQDLRYAKLHAAPDFDVGPFFSQESVPDRERVLGIGFSFPLPLWDSNRGETDTARAHISQAESKELQALRSLEQDLSQQYEAYLHILELLQKCSIDSLQELKEATDFADRQYRLGAISVQSYLEMQDQYLEATAALLETIREGHEHFLKIQLLTSDPTLLPKIQIQR